VKDCIQSFNGKLEIYTLPGYSPELNPVEQVWNNVKNHGIGRKKVFGPDHLKRMLLGQLRKLQKLLSIAMSFFRHPECSYVLA
jgi:transposase